MAKMLGPTYETRNKEYLMDRQMYDLLRDALMRKGRKEMLVVFAEGLKAERIFELEGTVSQA